MICPRCGPNATTYPGRWANECGSCRATLLNDDHTEQEFVDSRGKMRGKKDVSPPLSPTIYNAYKAVLDHVVSLQAESTALGDPEADGYAALLKSCDLWRAKAERLLEEMKGGEET